MIGGRKRQRLFRYGGRRGRVRESMPDSQQRYRVLQKIDAGGMAEVYLAEREGLEGFAKQVAIKRVLAHLSEKERFIRMFLDEARLSARLNHSNCVQVFDIGYGENSYFIVMEWVDGTSLKALVDHYRRLGQSIPAPIAVHIVLEVAKGLAYAHELRDSEGRELHIIHRDISPPNVLLSRYGEVKIVDFGLAKANSQLEKSEPGIIKGKFGYLSPEAALGQEIDARTDVFALGIMLWELLAGRRLFLGETDFQTVRLVQQAVVPDISAINSSVPQELARIIEKSLARLPEDRIATAYDFGQQLARVLFEMGVTVTDFDVASLVRSSLGQKEGPSTQIIDRLIKESLFEFVSIGRTTGGSPDLVTPPNRKLKLGAEPLLATYEMPAIQDPNRVPEPLRSLPARALEEGNLAALEDDVPPASSQAAYDRLARPLEVPGIPRFSGAVMANSPGSSEAAAADRSHKFRQALLGGLVVLAVSLLGYAIYDVVTH
jgi:serine/threonine protein kinase